MVQLAKKSFNIKAEHPTQNAAPGACIAFLGLGKCNYIAATKEWLS